MFYSINFVMYNVESVLLSFCVFQWNDLLIYTMLFNGFILPKAFFTLVYIYMGIKLRTEFAILWEIILHSYRKRVECIRTIILTCQSQSERNEAIFCSNPVIIHCTVLLLLLAKPLRFFHMYVVSTTRFSRVRQAVD